MAASSSPILTGTLTTLGLVLVGSLITSLLLHFSSLSEFSLSYFTYTVNGISLLIGGLIAGKQGGHKGWYFGGLTGMVYFVLLVLIGFLAFDMTPHLSALLYLAIAFLVGAVGGIFGVNLANK
ncbi:TIGR04086 family membrane protein [Ammoniphilus sp. CFH 90114]|nr:TIGR04086 family membrane protein [Ammoniphilus sp. CFH 90114]RXT15492.1 TIGR04086 family membrane protein [Ammoniphilus sp. CFH 90114]